MVQLSVGKNQPDCSVDFGLPLARPGEWDQWGCCGSHLGRKWWGPDWSIEMGRTWQAGRSDGLGDSILLIWRRNTKVFGTIAQFCPSSHSFSVRTPPPPILVSLPGSYNLALPYDRAHTSWIFVAQIPIPPSSWGPACILSLCFLVRSVFITALSHQFSWGVLGHSVWPLDLSSGKNNTSWLAFITVFLWGSDH